MCYCVGTDHLATGSDSEHDEDELFDSQHSQMALSRRASALNSPFANLNLDADGGLMNLGQLLVSLPLGIHRNVIVVFGGDCTLCIMLPLINL